MNFSILNSDGICTSAGFVTREENIPALKVGESLLSGVSGRVGKKWNNGVWEEPPAQVVVPAEVSPWQMRRALNQLGLRATVEAAVAAADQDTKDGWEFATVFRRDNAMLNAMATALGLTSTDMDNLFILAATFNQ